MYVCNIYMDGRRAVSKMLFARPSAACIRFSPNTACTKGLLLGLLSTWEDFPGFRLVAARGRFMRWLGFPSFRPVAVGASLVPRALGGAPGFSPGRRQWAPRGRLVRWLALRLHDMDCNL